MARIWDMWWLRQRLQRSTARALGVILLAVFFVVPGLPSLQGLSVVSGLSGLSGVSGLSGISGVPRFSGLSGVSTLQAQEADPVGLAEDWFAAVSTMRSDFIQVASNGQVARGELHLRRPHQIKIIYDSDEPLIVLTSKVWLHVDRPNRREIASYPISQTPLSLILKENVRLRANEFTTSHSRRDGIVSIVLRQNSGEGAGTLTLDFTEKPFTLRRWTVEDAAGVTTSVTLQNPSFGHGYKNEFFAVNQYFTDN